MRLRIFGWLVVAAFGAGLVLAAVGKLVFLLFHG